MKAPKIAQIIWLLKKISGKVQAIGFIRDHHDGFYIINDATGSYYSGHAEFWEDKWREYLNSGYLPEGSARGQGIIGADWMPPSINEEDFKLIEKIKTNVL